jgi:hypothetical protein
VHPYIQYLVEQLYDIRYPGMVPILCVNVYNTNARLFCLIEMENSFFLPLFNHVGDGFSSPNYCNW